MSDALDVPRSAADHPSATRVVGWAASRGLELDVREYPEGTRTAVDAAAAVDCSVDQIVKSMIFDAGGELVLALTSGTNRVDAGVLAGVAGAERCDRADPEAVRAVTGYAIGGVPPFGHTTPLRTWIDPHLLTFDEVWAAAGTPRHVFPISPEALVDLTGAEPAPFAVEG